MKVEIVICMCLPVNTLTCVKALESMGKTSERISVNQAFIRSFFLLGFLIPGLASIPQSTQTSVNADQETLQKRSSEDIFRGWFLTDSQNSCKRMLRAGDFKCVAENFIANLGIRAEFQPCFCPFLSFMLT